jgi:DNA invertase Pin-like site-specific DNA recombinase
MKKYFAYIRVSTVKQGEKGSSLQEQQAAIDAYARRHNLAITEWFEEKETAAKQGRPIFIKMVKGLEHGLAAGVITHKIDRSARNLRDWAMLGELVDRGIELHFAHESIDLSSRGGRLSADIQAVVAADYIRNLRDEVKKGFYGRLKQGLYPLQAPLGYLDQGGGQPKTIDPVRGPLVAKAFALYATGQWSLETLSQELYSRGLRPRKGRRVTRNGWSTALNNPFYVGLIRIEKTREVFQGVHEPLVGKALFDRVGEILGGRTTHKANIHRFRYQRTLKCSTCGRSLTASRRKGHVYYRCATPTCPTTCLREEVIDGKLRAAAESFSLTEEEWTAVKADIETVLAHRKTDAAAELQNLSLATSAIDERLGRLTDAYVDQMVDRETYLARKEQLLGERATLTSSKASIEAGDDGIRLRVEKSIELIKTLGNLPNLENDDKLREILKDTVSNLTVCQKNVAVTWANPFNSLVFDDVVTAGGPKRIKHRTFALRVNRLVATIIAHSKGYGQNAQSSEKAAAL